MIGDDLVDDDAIDWGDDLPGEPLAFRDHYPSRWEVATIVIAAALASALFIYLACICP